MSRREVFSAIAAVPTLGATSAAAAFGEETRVSTLGRQHDAARLVTKKAFVGEDYPLDFHFVEDDVAHQLIAARSVNVNDLKIKAKALFYHIGHTDRLWNHPEEWSYEDIDEGLIFSMIEDILALSGHD